MHKIIVFKGSKMFDAVKSIISKNVLPGEL